MLDSVIALLQKISNKSKKAGTGETFSTIRIVVLLFLILSFVWLLYMIIQEFPFNFIEGLVTIILLLYITWLIFRIARVHGSNSVYKIMSFEIIPTVILALGILLILENDVKDILKFLPLIIVGLGLIPHVLGSFFKRLKDSNILSKISGITIGFNLIFSFILLTHTFFTLFGIPGLSLFDGYQDFVRDMLRQRDFEGLIGYFFVFILFFFQVKIYKTYLNEFGKNKFKFLKYFFIFLLIYNIGAISIIKEHIYNKTLSSTIKELQQNGENYESYKNAQGYLFEKAILSNIKQGRTNYDEVFSKIYDATPEEYFGEKIAKYRDNRRSFATDSSKVGDAAKVILNLAETENTIIAKGGKYFVESEYSFHFENTDSINQEVILRFQTPNKYSVITNLVLGLNGELQGQIAPRGAAKKVYEDSLRRNIDPALIEKIGLNTYSLRVFPVLGLKKQKVVVSLVSPILEKDIVYAPKFSYINLKTNEDSRAISKLYDDKTLIKEDIKKGNEVDSYLASQQVFNSDVIISDDTQACYHPFLSEIINDFDINLENKRELGSKISIFFDNSASSKRNNTDDFYNNIYSQLKNYGEGLQDLDVYSYNFEVKKLAELSDIKYWGYSNTDSIVDFISKNKIENQKIIIVTDDSSYNYSSDEISYDSETIATNEIHVIKVGSSIKQYKSDLNMLISESGGNIYEYADGNFTEELNNILGEQSKLSYKDCSEDGSSNFTDPSNKREYNNYKEYLEFLFIGSDSEEHDFIRFMNNIASVIVDDRYAQYYSYDTTSGSASLDINTKQVFSDYRRTHPGYRTAIEFIGEKRMIAMIDDLLEIIALEQKENEDKEREKLSSTIRDSNDTPITISRQNLTVQGFVQAGVLSEILLAQNGKDISEIQEIQNLIAENFGIVNHFNSYIALETEQQQRDLDKYSVFNDAYESDFENFGSQQLGRQVAPRGTGWGGVNEMMLDESRTIINSGSRRVGGGLQISGGGETMLMGGSSSYYHESSFSLGNEIGLVGLIKLILYIYCIFAYLHLIYSFFKNEENEENKDHTDSSENNTSDFASQTKNTKNSEDIEIENTINIKKNSDEIVLGKIHKQLVDLYEADRISDLKKICFEYIKKGYVDKKINFYLKKALEAEEEKQQ